MLKEIGSILGFQEQEPDYSVTFLGILHRCDLGVSFTVRFRKKKYRIIRNIFTGCGFDP